MITLADIEAAAKRLHNVAVTTPLLRSAVLDEVAGAPILVKPECWQVTGSFKIRGAYNLLQQLSPAAARRGVVAWSSGNHAQGVAAAAKRLGIHAAIVMPADAPRAKLANTRALGGEVITYDRYHENREAIARALADERDATLVPSFEHPDIIAGQGTVGLEIAQQAAALQCPIEHLLVPCGGGGLTAGTALAVHAEWPAARIYTVEPEHYDDTQQSLDRGERVPVPTDVASICDALLTDMPGELTFGLMRQHVAGGLVVTEAEVKAAMRFARQHLKLVVEPGGAAALAALLGGHVELAGGVTVVVLSGGNVDITLFDQIQREPA